MWRLCFTVNQMEQIVAHALSERPREACGLLGGTGDRVEEILPLANVAKNPTHEYQLSGRDLVESMTTFRQHGQNLIGIYHSHPTGDPAPSQTDIRLATYPESAYLIVGLGSSEPQMAAWRIYGPEITQLELHVGPYVVADDPGALSPAQKTAIVLTGIVSVFLVLYIALSLLPPAPLIIQTPIP